jgi:hypothetical protein
MNDLKEHLNVDEVQEANNFEMILRKKPRKENQSKRKEKEEHKSLIDEAKYLINVCSLPLSMVSRRLDLSYHKLCKVSRNNFENPDLLF